MTGLLLFIPALACIIGLNVAASRGREQLAIGLLFGMGLLLGLAVGPVIADYANADPAALWQAAGATAAFVAALGAYGYATRRDLSSWARTLFWATLALIVFGIVAIFVSIPNGNIIWAVAGLGIFGAWTIYDFNQIRRAGSESAGADRRKHLPRHLQHLPVLPEPVRRGVNEESGEDFGASLPCDLRHKFSAPCACLAPLECSAQPARSGTGPSGAKLDRRLGPRSAQECPNHARARATAPERPSRARRD